MCLDLWYQSSQDSSLHIVISDHLIKESYKTPHPQDLCLTSIKIKSFAGAEASCRSGSFTGPDVINKPCGQQHVAGVALPKQSS